MRTQKAGLCAVRSRSRAPARDRSRWGACTAGTGCRRHPWEIAECWRRCGGLINIGAGADDASAGHSRLWRGRAVRNTPDETNSPSFSISWIRATRSREIGREEQRMNDRVGGGCGEDLRGWISVEWGGNSNECDSEFVRVWGRICASRGGRGECDCSGWGRWCFRVQ